MRTLAVPLLGRSPSGKAHHHQCPAVQFHMLSGMMEQESLASCLLHLQLNNRPVEVLRGGQLVTVPWRDVMCGDVVKVSCSHMGKEPRTSHAAQILQGACSS